MSIIGRDANKNKKCFAACQPGTYCECLGKTIEEKDCGFSDISCILQHMSSVAKSEELVGNLQIAGDIECWVDQIRQLNTTTRPPVAGLAELTDAVSWQHRFQIKDTEIWSDWQQSATEAASKKMVANYKEMGLKAESRKLYSEPQPVAIGLSDRQWYEIWNYISSQEITGTEPLPLDYFGNLARQWLAENVAREFLGKVE